MDLTIRLTEKEAAFLKKLIARQKSISREDYTLEDAIRECIRDSMFDEGEETAQEEFE